MTISRPKLLSRLGFPNSRRGGANGAALEFDG